MTENPRNAMVCDAPHFKTSSVTPGFFYVFSIILSFYTCSQSFKKIGTWEILGANVLKFKFMNLLAAVNLELGDLSWLCSNETKVTLSLQLRWLFRSQLWLRIRIGELVHKNYQFGPNL